jgi:hypothetical protein
VLAMHHTGKFDTLYSEFDFLWPDLSVFVVVIALTASSGTFFVLRDKAYYLEAKMSAQMLIVIALFFFGAQILHYRPGDPLSAVGPVLSESADAFKSPHLWVALMVAVSFFNRWFTKVVDKELEQGRA